MTRLFVFILLLPLLTGGCALLPAQSDTPAPVVTDTADPVQRAERLRDQARILRYRDRYAEALARLDEAIALRPDDPDLTTERAQTERSWQLMQGKLQDRMRVIETTERIERLPLLVRLVRADPDDTQRHEQLQALRDQLQTSAEGLSECGRRQSREAPDLARHCLRLALALRDQHDDQTLLTKLEQNTQPRRSPRQASTLPVPMDSQSTTETNETVAEPQGTSAPPRPELIKARELIKAGNHFGAIRHLKKLQEMGLDSDESRRLLVQAETALAGSTKVLLNAGDLLYRQGKVKEALALWDAALGVDPYNPDARRKSERAARVLINLEVLDEMEARPTRQ